MQLIDEVETKVFQRLPDDTWFYPGHGNDSTIGAERPSLGGVALARLVDRLGLTAPRQVMREPHSLVRREELRSLRKLRGRVERAATPCGRLADASSAIHNCAAVGIEELVGDRRPPTPERDQLRVGRSSSVRSASAEARTLGAVGPVAGDGQDLVDQVLAQSR